MATVAVCLAAAYAAYNLANYSWAQVADYRSPYTAVSLPAAASGSACTSRTVYVIIDGLTESTSRELDTMNRLRSYGADYILEAGQPSLSYPNWTNLLSGAPATISGVTTNDYVGPVKVETLFQTAARAKKTTAFVGPEDFQKLYDVRRYTTVSFMRPWSATKYMSGLYVDQAITIANAEKVDLLVMHLPDIDEAGHRSGSSSTEYTTTARRVDADLNRLVSALQDGSTDFVVVADHGHIAGGGHGGWEEVVTEVPGIFSGPGIAIATGTISQSDVAPTVAVLAGIPVPRNSEGAVVASVVGNRSPKGLRAAGRQLIAASNAYSEVVATTPPVTNPPHVVEAATVTAAENQYSILQDDRLARERDSRRIYVFAAVIGAILLLVLVGLSSWRALVAALAGTAAFYVVYDGLFFVVHGYQWSLSVFNRSEQVSSFINARLAEAAFGAVVGVAVAALLYPVLRDHPKPPSGRYLPGWLTLGPTMLLVAMATLAVQVGFYVWQWGITATWRLPDLKWAVKYDFDLIQIVGLGAVAIIAPLVTYLVGRYHPKVRRERASVSR